MTVIEPELIVAVVALAFTAFPCVFGTFWAYLSRDGAVSKGRSFAASVLCALAVTAAAVVPLTIVLHDQALRALEEQEGGDGGAWAFRGGSAVAVNCGGEYAGYAGRGAREGADPTCRGARDGYWRADYYDFNGAGECVTVSLCAAEFDAQVRVVEREAAACVGDATTVDDGCAGSEDDGAGTSVSFYARPNVEYAVIVDSSDKTTGNYQLSFNCTQCAAPTPPPAASVPPTPPPAASVPPTPTPYDTKQRIWNKKNLLTGAKKRLLDAHESWQLYVSLAVVSGLLLLCSILRAGSLTETGGNDDRMAHAVLLSISFTCLLVGFSLFAELSKDVALIDRFQYEGPVYIEGYRIVDDNTIFQNAGRGSEGFRAELMLRWSGGWGCPYEPNEDCPHASSAVAECHRRPCKKLRACTVDERKAARDAALSCLSESVNGFDFEGTTMELNASIPPEENTFWPKRTGYYECANACAFEESLDKGLKRVRVLKGTGWTFVALGLAFLGLVLGCLLSLVPGAVYAKFS